MRKLKLDIDVHVDLMPIIDHWCRGCQRVHEFQVDRAHHAYKSTCGCGQTVTFLQLTIEGRLIESKWKGIYKPR